MTGVAGEQDVGVTELPQFAALIVHASIGEPVEHPQGSALHEPHPVALLPPLITGQIEFVFEVWAQVLKGTVCPAALHMLTKHL